MTEPTTSTVTAIAASLSGITLALLGVEYHALLWAFVGAMLAMANSAGQTMGWAVGRVVLSTLVGAALGSGAIAALDASKPALLIVLSLLGGAGADQLVKRALDAIGKRIDGAGGSQ